MKKSMEFKCNGKEAPLFIITEEMPWINFEEAIEFQKRYMPYIYFNDEWNNNLNIEYGRK